MKNYVSIEELLCNEDFFEEFCDGCAGLRLVHNYPDEPDYYECKICGGDISDPDCLKSNYYENIEQAFNDLEETIHEALRHTGESRFIE